jgi:hypothetical protein
MLPSVATKPCDDLAVDDLEGGGLQRVAALDGDEARQAVDAAIADDPRHVLGENSCERGVNAHDLLDAHDRHNCGGSLSAAVRVDSDIRSE